jgi:hypothetical protein
MGATKRDRTVALWIVAMVAALAVVRVSKPIHAQADVAPPPYPDKLFGGAHIATGESAQVNVAQIGDPTIFSAGVSCGIIINYFGADGSLLSEQQLRLEPGKMVFADLRFSDLTRNSLLAINRIPFRVVVRRIGDPNQNPDPCAQVRATVEARNILSGETIFFVEDPNE